jgi:very-short-patch-repair endonuclease
MKNKKISIYTIARKLRQNMTKAEKILWEKLRNNTLGVRINRQVGFHFGNYRYVADFCCHSKSLIIEIDGDIHNNQEIMEYDQFREDVFRDMGYKVIRFTNEEVYKNIDKVLKTINQYIKIKKHPFTGC